MRKWEDLTETEKEKFKAYFKFCTDFDIAYIGILILTYVFTALSAIYIFRPSHDIFDIWLATFFISISIALYVIASWGNTRFKKKMFMIFGFKDTSQLFGIKSQDYKKVKIHKTELWEKVE
jgi:hypothetical protein